MQQGSIGSFDVVDGSPGCIAIEDPGMAAHAGEMISELTLAITNKLTMQALAETVHCYPTQAEVFQRIALSYKPARIAAQDRPRQKRRGQRPVTTQKPRPAIQGKIISVLQVRASVIL